MEAMTERLKLPENGNHSVFVGVVGNKGEIGRRFVSEEYMSSMLEHKIVVVAQKDKHEDHYRLMEAFASGALVFSDPMVVPPKRLVDGHDYIVYRSMEDLESKLLYYLNCPRERLRIAYNGWLKVMTEYRSWHMMEKLVLGEARADI